METEVPFQEYHFQPMSLQLVAQVLETYLKKDFNSVSVLVKDCPDLSLPPYCLAAKGFGATPITLIDLGGPPYLVPVADKSKVYKLAEIVSKFLLNGSNENEFFVGGSGAGPWQLLNSNCEMMVNFLMNNKGRILSNKSKIAVVNKDELEDPSIINLALQETRCALLSNLYVSDGRIGKVLDIKCKGRRDGAPNFTQCIRQALLNGFPDQPIGLGGIFLTSGAPIKIHVMRDFSKTPLESDDQVNEWLKFYEIKKDMLFQSVAVSCDPGLDLRLEHSHGWSLDANEPSIGGHYHYDTDGENVEYHGLYCLAEKLIRVDKPSVTHQIGRD